MKYEKEFGRDMGSLKEVASVQEVKEAMKEVKEVQSRQEGQLSKFTNVVKGWQYRWFVLEPETGQLDYYLPEDRARSRGSQHLAGAVVLPSVEDGHTFSINFSSGEVYKVRASQVRERQVWVDRLRVAAHRHTEARDATKPAAEGDQLQSLSLSALGALGSVHDVLRKVEEKQRLLAEAIEALPPGREREEGEEVGSTVTPHCHDPKLLLLKATSHSTVVSMEAALALLHQLREEQLATVQISQSPPPSPNKSTP